MTYDPSRLNLPQPIRRTAWPDELITLGAKDLAFVDTRTGATLTLTLQDGTQVNRAVSLSTIARPADLDAVLIEMATKRF